MKTVLMGVVIWCGVLFMLWHIRPNSKMHHVVFHQAKKTICFIACIFTIIICTIPMSLSPIWNGDIPAHRNQYELFADSILDGHLYFDYEVDQKLLEMDNPYDHDAREELGVDYHWDHSFFDGKYYMYFGIVPALLVFVPFKLITGSSLTTYHATQLFVALFIIGLFKLFKQIASRFFKDMTNAVFVFSCVSFSLMSVWYFVDAPSLYCTAISSAVCFEIWSFYFFFNALFVAKSQKSTVFAMTIGSLFGALAFGCRPTVAMANIILIPVLVTLIKEKRIEKKLTGKLLIILIPYVVTGVLLMWYNYARFGSVFEFGQSYQLTVTDQSSYGSLLSHLSIKNTLSWILYYLLTNSFSNDLLSYGVFITYPVVALSCIWIFKRSCFDSLKRSKLKPFVVVIIISILIIIAFSSACAPYPIPRYRTDIFWLIAILSFMFIGFETHCAENKSNCSSRFSFLMCLSMVASVILFFVPHDQNFTECEGLSLYKLLQIISFGLI